MRVARPSMGVLQHPVRVDVVRRRERQLPPRTDASPVIVATTDQGADAAPHAPADASPITAAVAAPDLAVATTDTTDHGCADAAPHAPAADAWPFSGTHAAPHARADAPYR